MLKLFVIVGEALRAIWWDTRTSKGVLEMSQTAGHYALGWIVLFANEGNPVVALPGKYGGLASVARPPSACSCGEEVAEVEIYSLGATSSASAFSSTEYATYPHFIIAAICHHTAGAV